MPSWIIYSTLLTSPKLVQLCFSVHNLRNVLNFCSQKIWSEQKLNHCVHFPSHLQYTWSPLLPALVKLWENLNCCTPVYIILKFYFLIQIYFTYVESICIDYYIFKPLQMWEDGFQGNFAPTSGHLLQWKPWRNSKLWLRSKQLRWSLFITW